MSFCVLSWQPVQLVRIGSAIWWYKWYFRYSVFCSQWERVIPNTVLRAPHVENLSIEVHVEEKVFIPYSTDFYLFIFFYHCFTSFSILRVCLLFNSLCFVTCDVFNGEHLMLCDVWETKLHLDNSCFYFCNYPIEFWTTCSPTKFPNQILRLPYRLFILFFFFNL